MIEVVATRVVIFNGGVLVLLQGSDDDRVLPIGVDPGQAQVIEMQLEGKQFPRPLTHDLLKTVVDEAGCKVVRVEVCDLVKGTFYARLVLLRDGKEIEIDARPSDAIAVALRCDAPIHIAESVMDAEGVVIHPEQIEQRQAATQQAVLAEKLERAIAEERYEDAAILRDEIKRAEDAKQSSN